MPIKQLCRGGGGEPRLRCLAFRLESGEVISDDEVKGTAKGGRLQRAGEPGGQARKDLLHSTEITAHAELGRTV